jgi:hypothetical protein
MFWRAGYLTVYAALDQTQRQLLSIGPAEAPDEFFKTRRYVRRLEVAAPLQFFSDIFGEIARRAFGGVEANDAHGVIVLAAQKVADHGFEVGCLNTSLPPAAAKNQIDGLILARDDRGSPVTH